MCVMCTVNLTDFPVILQYFKDYKKLRNLIGEY